MSISLILACFWVLAATGVAFLPMRYQYIPGLTLLVLLVPLLIFIGSEHSPWVVIAALAAAVSMFRRPLMALARYFLRRLRGKPGRQI